MTDAKKVTIFSHFKIKYGNMRKNPPPPDIVYFRIFPFISDKENAFYNKSFVEKATYRIYN